MIQLDKALKHWGSPDFEQVLKAEIAQLDGGQLPLQQGLSVTSHAVDKSHSAMIIRVSEEPDILRVKAGIFYRGIIPGCSCADDPTPVDEVSEYCEVELCIDRHSAATRVRLLQSPA